jgi:hypothetical protein
MRGAGIVFMGKPKQRGPLGRPGCKWESNIKMDVKEICWLRMWAEWIKLRTGSSIGVL